MKNNNKSNKIVDIIVFIVSLILVVFMVVFTVTRGADEQQLVLMEIYKSGGAESSNLMNHYYIYSNSNVIKIRNFDSGSNVTVSKDVNRDLINDFKDALDKYVTQKPYISSDFYRNERYTIEYNDSTLTIPNPSIATALGYEAAEYSFYNVVDNFINKIKN